MSSPLSYGSRDRKQDGYTGFGARRLGSNADSTTNCLSGLGQGSACLNFTLRCRRGRLSHTQGYCQIK